MPILQQHGGRLLAADEQPEVLEGEWQYQKAVLMSFPDQTTFLTWANSPDYLEISKDRTAAAANGVTLLLHGIG